MCSFRLQRLWNAYIWAWWLEATRSPTGERISKFSFLSSPPAIFMTVTVVGLAIVGIIYAAFNRSTVAAQDDGIGRLPCKYHLSCNATSLTLFLKSWAGIVSVWNRLFAWHWKDCNAAWNAYHVSCRPTLFTFNLIDLSQCDINEDIVVENAKLIKSLGLQVGFSFLSCH